MRINSFLYIYRDGVEVVEDVERRPHLLVGFSKKLNELSLRWLCAMAKVFIIDLLYKPCAVRALLDHLLHQCLEYPANGDLRLVCCIECRRIRTRIWPVMLWRGLRAG